MKPKFWQTKEFKKLEKQWYLKLQKEKFQDAERKINGEPTLKQHSYNSYKRAPITVIDAKQRYYELLQQGFEEETGFLDHVERLVMERKCSGILTINICKELEEMGDRCSRWTVRAIIRRYEIKWRIRKT